MASDMPQSEAQTSSETQPDNKDPSWADAGLDEPSQEESQGQPEESGQEPPGEQSQEKADAVKGEPEKESNGSRSKGDGKEEVSPASFGQLKEGELGASEENVNMILDIPVVLSVELGRTKMLINDLLQLGQGSIIELDKLAGEPMEILINGKLMARGEVVVVNEKFGVRLTDIISPTERIKQLG